MTNYEAIRILDNERPGCGEKVVYSEEERYEAYDIAKEALEKQIPKKPKINLHGTTDYNTKCTCPSCGGFVCTDKYCRNCGQALDWGR